MHRHNVYSSGWMSSYTPADQNIAPVQSGLGAFLAQMTIRLVLGLANWLEKSRVRAELMAMDDRELADIGLVRTDIELVADGRFDAGRSYPLARPQPREKGVFLSRLAA